MSQIVQQLGKGKGDGHLRHTGGNVEAKLACAPLQELSMTETRQVQQEGHKLQLLLHGGDDVCCNFSENMSRLSQRVEKDSYRNKFPLHVGEGKR